MMVLQEVRIDWPIDKLCDTSTTAVQQQHTAMISMENKAWTKR